MTFPEFVNWALAQGSVDKVQGSPNGELKGQCVSLINQYLSKVHGIEAGAWGHAKAWANDTNPIRQWFYPVNRSQAGDIGVYTGGQYGHIWIYRDNDIIEQNGRVPLKVTISPDRNASVILRPKAGMPQAQGGNMPSLVNQGDVNNIYEKELGRSNGGDGNGWVGQPWPQVWYGVKDSPEGQAYNAKVATALAGYDTLKKQVEELSSRPTKEQLQAVVDKVTELNGKLDEADKALEDAKNQKTQDTQLLDEGKNAFDWLTRLIDRLKGGK